MLSILAPLYAQNERDEVSVQFVPFLRWLPLTSATNNILTEFTIPLESALLLSSISYVAIAGVNKSVADVTISIRDPAGTIAAALHQQYYTGVLPGTSIINLVPVQWLIPPGQILRLNTNFAGGTVEVNEVRIGVLGILVPRGNIAL